MQVTTISAARGQLDRIARQVSDDAEPVMILLEDDRKVVMISEQEYASWHETAYLLSNPANAAHLRQSLAEADKGRITERALIEP